MFFSDDYIYLCIKLSTMKKIILLIVLALTGVLTWYFWETKPKPDNEVAPLQAVTVSKYSDTLNQSINALLDSYYGLSEAFVNWDSSTIRSQTIALKGKVENLSLKEVQKDTAIYETAASYQEEFKTNLSAIESNKDLTEKRRAFHSLSQNMYDLLRTIQYDASKVFLQECPMAFNDTESGLWLSKTDAIRNPYLGLHHPKYKSGMLECGEVKDSLTIK
jgi:hypothetical protein